MPIQVSIGVVDGGVVEGQLHLVIAGVADHLMKRVSGTAYVLAMNTLLALNAFPCRLSCPVLSGSSSLGRTPDDGGPLGSKTYRPTTFCYDASCHGH